MKEKIRSYIAQLREVADKTPLPTAYDWAVAQERCDVLNEVADSLERMLMEQEEFEVRKYFEVYDALENILPERNKGN